MGWDSSKSILRNDDGDPIPQVWDEENQQWIVYEGKRYGSNIVEQIANQEEMIDLLRGTENTFGVEWDASSSSTTLTRKGDASGLSQSDFDNIHPWAGMRRCNLADDGTVNNYYGDPDYATDGSNGQVMVEIPKFYYKVYQTENGYVWMISPNDKAGYFLHPAFSRAGITKENIYIGAFEATVYDDSAAAYVGDGITYDYVNDVMASVGSLQPISGNTDHLDINESRSLAENRESGWSQQDFLTISALQLLYLVEYADFDIQTKISEGITNLDSGTGNHSQNTGHTTGNSTQEVIIGTLENGASGAIETYAMSYRGVENLYGNIWNFIDGLILKDDGFYYEDDIMNFNDTASGYDQVVSSPLTDNNGYINDIEFFTDSIDYMFLGKKVSGSSSTYLCDYQHSHDAGETNVALVGGPWFFGLMAGCFCWRLRSVVSYSYRYIGARLLYVG